MKVALVTWKVFPSYVGGSERHARQLAISLAAQGATVDVLCAEVPPGDDARSLPFTIVPLGWSDRVPNLVGDLLFSRRAARRIAAGNYDVAYGQNLALWAYVGRKGIPCVTNPQGLEPFKMPGSWTRARGWTRRRALRYTAGRSDAVVSLGGRMTHEIERVLHIPAERVVELPAGVDLADLDRLRSPVPPPKIAASFLCVARLAFNKGVDVLMEAFRLLESRSPARLYVIGDGPERAQLAAMAPANVTLLGSLPDAELVAWYERAEALVLPSRFEGLGIVILEAMAFGLPIIATDVGAVTTMVDAENGVVVEPGSPTSLATAIEALLSRSPAERARLGARSRARVEASFNWDALGGRALDVFARLAARRPE